MTHMAPLLHSGKPQVGRTGRCLNVGGFDSRTCERGVAAQFSTGATIFLIVAVLCSPCLGEGIFDVWPQQNECAIGSCVGGVCSPSRQATHPAVCTVSIGPGDPAPCTGGLVWVGDGEDQALVVTISHSGVADADSMLIDFPDGQSFTGHVATSNRADDLTLVRIPAPRGIKPIAIAAQHARPDDAAHWIGYGGRQWRRLDGRVVGYAAVGPATPKGTRLRDVDGAAHTSLVVDVAARPGDSGSPILNQRGELIAVVSSYGHGETLGAYSNRVRVLLDEAIATVVPPLSLMVPVEVADTSEDTKPAVVVDDHLDKIRVATEEDLMDVRAVESERPNAIEALIAASEHVVKLPPVAPSLIEKALPATLAALGWTGPPSVVALLAAKFGLSWWRKRRKPVIIEKLPGGETQTVPFPDLKAITQKTAPAPDLPENPAESPVYTSQDIRGDPDAPQAPNKYRIDTQFVNVESDHYQRAHELARQQIARRYPGSQEILEAELSLTRQFAAGLPT